MIDLEKLNHRMQGFTAGMIAGFFFTLWVVWPLLGPAFKAALK